MLNVAGEGERGEQGMGERGSERPDLSYTS